MAEKTKPELPYTLGTWPSPNPNGQTLDLVVTSVTSEGVEVYARRHFKDGGVMMQGGGFFDPAELMRNLAAFVPEVEPVAWMDTDGDFFVANPRHLTGGESHRKVYIATPDTADLHLALYAHPPVTAEPALVPEAANAREVIARGLVDEHSGSDVDVQDFDLKAATSVLKALDARGLSIVDARGMVTAEPNEDAKAVIAHWLAYTETSRHVDAHAAHLLGTLAAAGYVVTAEPAPAPSVEQIAEVLFDHDYERMECSDHVGQCCPADDGCHDLGVTQYAHWAEEIHALYGTPGDVDEPEWRQKYRAIRELEAELAEANEMRIDLANRVTEVENIARAEVERCKAALEAADAWMFARNDFEATEAARQEAEVGAREARKRLTQRVEQYRAARAAVEAETSEEADRG